MKVYFIEKFTETRDEEISLYRNGGFHGLLPEGPHVAFDRVG